MSSLPPIPSMDSGMGAGMDPTVPAVPIMPGEDQPIEVRLRPETRLHGEIVQKLRARLDLSYRNVSTRYPDWDRVDEHLRFFVDLTRAVRKGDKTMDTSKKENPFDRAIVVPASYAIHEVRKTQLFSLFGHREPFIQLQGRGPEDEKPAALLEAVLDYDFSQSRGAVSIYSMLADADKYGMGIVYDHWEDQAGFITVPPRPPTGLMAIGVGLGIVPPPGPTREWGTLKEFNRWSPVDPFNFWPDPRVSIANLQEGEFIGHRALSGFMQLMERSADSGGPYFNLDKLKEVSGSGARGDSSRLVGRNRFAVDQFALKELGDDKDKGYYTLDHLQVKLIPKDWKLGPEDKPEIWWFTLADERTIIRAHKCAYEHGQFCYSVAEVNPDPHTIANPGMLENLDGLQRTINWLLNSHIENVRKTINNELIFDPRLIEESDVMNPGPGRWIRLTAEGSEALRSGQITLDAMYSQLKVSDLTGGHMNLVQALFDMMQRMSAASDPMMGSETEQNKTLGEIQAIVAGASQRLGVSARIIDAQAITPLAERAIANRQQFTSVEQYFRIAGDLAKAYGGQALQRVKQADLQGNFDYVPHSALSHGDPARMAQIWQQVLQTAAAYPQVTAPGPDGRYLDIREVFNEMVRQLGIRNLDEYYLTAPQVDPMTGLPVQPQMSVMPDEQVQAQAQAGNYAPVS